MLQHAQQRPRVTFPSTDGTLHRRNHATLSTLACISDYGDPVKSCYPFADGINGRDSGFDASVQWSCNILKTMELVSGLEPPFGLRITNGDNEDVGTDCDDDN